MTTHVLKYDIFSCVFDIANQLLTRHSPFVPLGLVNEWTAKPSPFLSIVVCRNFLRLWLLKHWKIRIAYRQWHSHFPWRERRPKYERKTESYVISGFGDGISRGWGRKSTNGRFATSRFLSCTLRNSFVGKEKKINGNFVYWKLLPYVVVFIAIQRLFSSWTLTLTLSTVFIRRLSILLPIFLVS